MSMIRGRSSIGFLLEALLPYSDANLKLAYKPSQFFRDLEKVSNYKKRSLQNAFYVLKKRGLVECEDGIPHLTAKGYAQLQLYKPEKLAGAYLMVIFDIPENDRNKRQKLRLLLRELRFVQTQKSVWMSEYECRDYLKAEIDDLKLGDYVKVFEAHQLTL